MRKLIGNETKIVEKYLWACDACEKELTDRNSIVIDDSWTDGYDWYGDREEIAVCSFRCLSDVLLYYDGNHWLESFNSPENESIQITLSRSHAKEFMNILRNKNG